MSYFRSPTLGETSIIFVSEETLGIVHLNGGIAQNLTSKFKYAFSQPRYNTDNSMVACLIAENGANDVAILQLSDLSLTRLTWTGGVRRILGWTSDDRILFSSQEQSCTNDDLNVYAIKGDGSGWERMPFGNSVADCNISSTGAIALLCNALEPAYWKRHRGGLQGRIWLGVSASGEFRPLNSIRGAFSGLTWLGERLFFVSDCTNVGNIHSCREDGSDVRQHTFFSDFYVRDICSDGSNIVFSKGGKICLFSPVLEEVTHIEIRYLAKKKSDHKQIVNLMPRIESLSLHPTEDKFSFVCRGRIFEASLTTECHNIYQQTKELRYRCPCWLSNGEELVASSDQSGENDLWLFSKHNLSNGRPLGFVNIGRVVRILASPENRRIAIQNFRGEIWIVDLDTNDYWCVPETGRAEIFGYDWYINGGWLTFAKGGAHDSSQILICNINNRQVHKISEGCFRDFSPSFCPSGDYLYFASFRCFSATAGQNFATPAVLATGDVLCVVSLRKNCTSDNTQKQGSDFSIDIEDITMRIRMVKKFSEKVAALVATKAGLLYFIAKNNSKTNTTEGLLYRFHPETKRDEQLWKGVNSLHLTLNREKMVVRTGKSFNFCATESINTDNEDDKCIKVQKKSIDLSGGTIEISLREEWRQMFRESWQYQRDHFWREDMNGLDWEAVYEAYARLAEKVQCRSELTDVILECAGELSSSHSFHMEESTIRSDNHVRFLGVDFSRNKELQKWMIDRVYSEDRWDENMSSPLARTFPPVPAGVALESINGVQLDERHPNHFLGDAKNKPVKLVFTKSNGEQICTNMAMLANEHPLRYRAWVEHNRRYVRNKSNGLIGYIHLPDMGMKGFAEFHRSIITELSLEGIVIDVRYNCGGNLSDEILMRLAQPCIGFRSARWFPTQSCPSKSPQGPMVVLINGHTRSDGEVFAHAFRMQGLGALVGSRSCGATVGMWPRNSLVDGARVTQAEFARWFYGSCCNLENVGIDPDISIENSPREQSNNFDRQLDAAVSAVLQKIDNNRKLK